MRLTLLVPELIWPEPNDQLTLGKLAAPGFEWLAAHAEFSRQPRRAFEHTLADHFGLTDAPFGALRLLGETGKQQIEEGHWLCADPVHLRFHHERIVLADAGAFELELEEAHAITAALNSEFADIGRFHVATARRWYLQLNATVNEKFAPISTIAGRRLDSDLTDKNGPLKPAVNSVWLWGGGPLGDVPAPLFSAVCSDNPLATGLALAAGIEAPPCPASLSTLLADSAPNDTPLVLLDTLLPPVLYENSDDWRNAFAALERDWFVPLRAALGGKIETLTIVAPTIYGQLTWTLHGKDRWKFWRKSRPLQAIAKELAEGTPQ
ncbi:MAG: hypothetical protein CVU31_07475 [Betaproteobacteria bacterium HGW-Betaproteobacteria-4]|nr:MAG: hypothetical protein CVU31_07475 [Betaproteobacteria bacterium HGW-Betaproteobacteria-4]